MKYPLLCILFWVFYFQCFHVAREAEALSLNADNFDIDDDYVDPAEHFPTFETPEDKDDENKNDENEGYATEGDATKSDSTKTDKIKEAKKSHSIPYVPPKQDGIGFVETFDGEVFSTWTKSAQKNFQGEWSVTTRKDQALVNDLGLKMTSENKFHGIAAKFPDESLLTSNENKDTIISYEVKAEQGWTCGGAYLKLFDTNTLSDPHNLATFDNKTPYVVMFGPDVCGSTNRVHVILKFENPTNKEWNEFHLKNPPSVPSGQRTHLYTLHLKSDNTYELLVDNKVTNKGSMFDDFEPPFANDEIIVDPDDVKPSDWVDEKMIFDTSAKKPDDWDENQPITIEDPAAVMPDDWNEDLEPMIPDPDAQEPENWNTQLSGEWKAPLIENPECKGLAGCGVWDKPMISNPKYKGKWVAPLIENPNYKGPWSPRKIANPNHYKIKNPHAIADVNAVGFELWTVHSGVLFDNIVISRDMPAVNSFIESTWTVRYSIEEKHDLESVKSSKEAHKFEKEDVQETLSWTEKMQYTLRFYFQEYPVACFTAIAVAFLSTMYLIITMLQQQAPAETPSEVTDSKATTAPETEEYKDAPETEEYKDAPEQGKKKVSAESEELKDKQETVTTRKRGAASSKQDT